MMSSHQDAPPSRPPARIAIERAARSDVSALLAIQKRAFEDEARKVQHGETLTLAVMTQARAPSPSLPDPEEPMHPVDPVQRQLEAYNARDLARFVAQYAQDVRVFRPPAPEPVLVGKAALARHYAEHRFTLPALHAEVVNRMVAGDIVVDHERITGLQPGVVEAIAVYAVADGLIHTVWFY